VSSEVLETKRIGVIGSRFEFIGAVSMLGAIVCCVGVIFGLDAWAGIPGLFFLLIAIVSKLVARPFLRKHYHEVRRFISLRSRVGASPEALPVLYLRSFSDDARASKTVGMLTEEEQLVEALLPFGPVLAVGRPGESLPEVGATRLYLSDDEWQERVARMMSEAILVVIRTGASHGLAWEVDTAVRAVAPQSLLLIVDSQAELDAMLTRMGALTGQQRLRVRLRGKRIASIRGMVAFDDNWAPQALTMRRGLFRDPDFDKPLVARFKLSLRPLLIESAGGYDPPPWSVALIANAVIWAFMALLAVAGAVSGIRDELDNGAQRVNPPDAPQAARR
jgi:hypothetical protein